MENLTIILVTIECVFSRNEVQGTLFLLHIPPSNPPPPTVTPYSSTHLSVSGPFTARRVCSVHLSWTLSPVSSVNLKEQRIVCGRCGWTLCRLCWWGGNTTRADPNKKNGSRADYRQRRCYILFNFAWNCLFSMYFYFLVLKIFSAFTENWNSWLNISSRSVYVSEDRAVSRFAHLVR